MDAKEYLNSKCPDTVAIINTYCPTDINLALILESYHQAKSKEEAEGGINIGDYVFASRWFDGTPNDPWYVGFVKGKIDNGKNGIEYMVDGSIRWWKYCRKITKEEGDKIMSEYPKQEIKFASGKEEEG